ncbi:P-loop containing nucleoside triphosphate hydrolase protein [Artomyces pyxidatus]|uniref:P-loop containing nucleoside triphosphate hydrolase protein n=1 Tax=Artomyces pyxidatus TaxID=48021 RepID=A0ACB8TG95_9AGAM|nr:P-loop containing nucleoside triphosphate hydrolase protein [Artomyces pyxidatus]
MARNKLKKDPGVPRLPDLKVKNAEKSRIRNSPPHDPNADATMASEPTLSTLALLASTSALHSDPSASDPGASSDAQKTKEQLRRHYIRTLHKVVDEADVVVLVLDARDPEGCRSRLVEEEVRRREAEGKKLVFVLNKIDLVPRANVQAWLKHLRHTTPTLPFRSASAHQRANLSSSTAPALLRLLKAYKPSAAQSVTVGVVGFPNVGKSSLINTLKRAKVCPVASQPGHTKDLQAVQLERGLRIVDSPGVIFDDADSPTASSVLLRNVVKVEDIDDPITVVEQILARTEVEKLMKIYNLPIFTSTLEFLTMLSLSTGRLLKGGTPDIIAAARQVLSDWNHQKIPFYSHPPTVHPSQIPTMVTSNTNAPTIAPGAEHTGQAQILTSLSAPFTLAGLFGEADAAMDAQAEAIDDGDVEIHDDDAWVDADEDSMTVDHTPQSRKRGRSPEVDADAELMSSGRAPKRLRRLAVRAASAPGGEILRARSRREARMARRKGGKEGRRGLRETAVGGMEIDD